MTVWTTVSRLDSASSDRSSLLFSLPAGQSQDVRHNQQIFVDQFHGYHMKIFLGNDLTFILQLNYPLDNLATET